MCIEKNGVLAFQNRCGITVDNFLGLLEFYLGATVVSFEDQFLLQKRGICIGSCVAPVLSEIFLAEVDEGLDRAMQGVNVLRTFRYVDDFLIILGKEQGVSLQQRVSVVLDAFINGGKGLTFTFETPVDNGLQFLDIFLNVCDKHVCWMYRPRVRKEFLPFDSAHSKTVKRAIASACLDSALKKSCMHTMKESFDLQISRLTAAGFPRTVVASVVEAMLKKMKGKTQSPALERQEKKTRPVVMPYTHKLAHNL